MPLAYGWGTGGIQVTAALIGADEQAAWLAKIEKAMAAADEQKGVCKPGPRTGVCQQMTELFSKGMDPKAVFEWVQKNLPKAKTSLKAVYWYRSYLRSQGALV